ncbi:MAG TPA: HAMP domain-containing sensor histidine kinase [Streptosporangiaceae bacterium]|jgi:signal transduction histidine kinase
MHDSGATGVLANFPGTGTWRAPLNVSIVTGVIAVVAVALGLLVLHRLSRRPIGLQLTLISAVSVVTALAGVGGCTWLMLGGTEYRSAMMEMLGIAGLAGFVVALVVGRRLTRASQSLLEAVEKTGDSGLYIAPTMALPAELTGLSDGLSVAHQRLAQARARERALEASRRELVAWVSHDLRTPLAGLRAMAEALEDQVVVDSRTVSAYHTQIRREVDRLSLMIDDLFELSRIHAGALRLTPRPVALEDVVAEVLASAEPVARAKGVRLAGSAVRGMPIFVDAAEFGRALRNLVINAIRHTPSDGTVEVMGDVQQGLARFSVSDACGGIPLQDLPRVFDVAFRGEAARTPGPQEGAGLGLSIARGIVEAHSGQIAVRNAGPGCQFLIRLPLARPAAPAPDFPAHTGPRTGTRTGAQRAVPAGL